MACDVLWVGEPTPASNVLREHGAHVDRVALDQGVERTAALAPDVVVLHVDTAEQAVLFAGTLRGQHTGATVPVVVLCDEEVADSLPAAERLGIVARLDSNAPGEDVALAVQTQMRAQADAEWQRPLSITASELDDWVARAARRGVCGLVIDGGTSQAMVLGPGAATVPTPQRFCESLPTEPISPMCFLQLPATRVRVVTEAPSEIDDGDLPDVRVAIVHPDPDMRLRWEHHMASAGAEVLLDEMEPQALRQLGEWAPDLLVVHEQALPELTRADCWRDADLVFSSLLVVSEKCAAEISPQDLVAEAALLLAAQTSVQARIADAGLLVERLESQGPARWLRDALCYDGVVEMVVNGPRGTARLRLDYGELLEARYRPRSLDAETLSGDAALSALRKLRFGRLIVGRPREVSDVYVRDRPSMAPAVHEPPAEAALPGPLAAPAVELLVNRANSQDVKRGARALPVAAVAALAVLTVAAWLARSDPPRQAAVHSEPAPAAEPSTSPTTAAASSPTPSAAPTAVAPNSPGVPEPTAKAAPPVPEPAAGAAPGVAEPAAGTAPSVAEPAAKAAIQPAEPAQSSAPTKAPTSGAANPTPAREPAPPVNVSLPSRLRRWTDPTPAQQLVIDAFRARAQRDLAAAARLLAQAREMSPTNAEAAYQLALTHARQGKLDEALRGAAQAMQLSPLDPAPLVLQGDLYIIRGQSQKARAVWEQCLRLRPQYSSCVRRLERLERRAGR